ncbi:MAG: SDR family oxidoreductase [Omnitrophica bacterium]|nr:SDR family oxidoreductase [Candidatus Omnitrophota bacterium]
MNNIFVTGATGFLGSLIVNEILSSSGDAVHILVRDKQASMGRDRLISALSGARGGELNEAEKNRIHAYKGDITKKGLGLNGHDTAHLVDTIDIIYHSAATTDLSLALAKARKINVRGAANVLDFAIQCKQNGRLKKVNHISTAYVAGTGKALFKEEHLDIKQGFNNTYEQSKFEAEKLAHEYRKNGLHIDIFRPSIMLGRYTDGKTTSFKMFYQPLHFFALEIFEKIPAKGHSKANVINVDTAARAMVLISNRSDKPNMTYHIVSPDSPTFELVLDTACDFFGFRKPDIVRPEELNMVMEYSFAQERMIAPYLPYFSYLTKFDMENTLNCLKKENFKFPTFDKANLIRLFEYCEKIGFIKRKNKSAVTG